MKRKSFEILHFKEGRTHDKVYILELVEDDHKNFYLYANYGKRVSPNLTKLLKKKTEDLDEAVAEMDKLISEKLRDDYKVVKNNSKLDIPGFKAMLETTLQDINLRNPQPQVRKNIDADDAEFRRINL